MECRGEAAAQLESWDARFEAEVRPELRAWVQVTNLLDANFQTRYGYPEPGWQLWAGLRLELGR